jgi:predicted  nucleic acid-binding Zn-ribbon protein
MDIQTLTAKYAVKAIIALTAIAAIAIDAWYIDHLKTKIAAQEKDLVVLRGNNETLSKAIDSQNKAIQNLQDAAAAALKEHQAELDAAKKATAQAKKKADSLYNAQPSNPANLCDSALNLLNGGAK